MKYVRFEHDNVIKLGFLNNNNTHIYELENTNTNDMIEFITNHSEETIQNVNDIISGKERTVSNTYHLDQVKILAPINKPIHDIICVGVNYLDHLKESANVLDTIKDDCQHKTVYFSKRATKFSGPNDLIESHQLIDKQLDYEVELAVVIGKRCLNINKEDAINYIFGYTIINDFSARTLQKQHVQWYRGKSLDTFSAIGPCIIHKSCLKLPLELDIKSYVNGEIRQDSNTKYLLSDISTIIAELSQGMTLEPGDIIATGTPAGVGMGFKPPRYLVPGDTISCVISEIGILSNQIK